MVFFYPKRASGEAAEQTHQASKEGEGHSQDEVDDERQVGRALQEPLSLLLLHLLPGRTRHCVHHPEPAGLGKVLPPMDEGSLLQHGSCTASEGDMALTRLAGE